MVVLKNLSPSKNGKLKRRILIVLFFMALFSDSASLLFAAETIQPVEGRINGGALTQQKCIELALANNPDIAARKWEVSQAEAQKDGSLGARWPSLRATGGYNYYSNAQRLIPARENGEPGVFSQTITGATLVLSMPLFTGGQITNRIKASELLQAASENRLARTREELIFNVTSVFNAVLGQQQVIGSLLFSIDALHQQISRIKDLISVQKGTRVDLLRTEVRLANLEQRLLQEKNTLLIQQRVLANLMGLKESEGPMTIEGQLNFIPMNSAVQISSENEILYWISLVNLKDLDLFENQASQSISFWPSQCCPN